MRALMFSAPAYRLGAPVAWLRLALLLVMAFGIAPPVHAQSAGIEPLTIVSKGGRHAFSVEVMRNDADRAQGLMYRRSLPADYGMLFDFGRVGPISMWMQNTYVSLDMIFIRKDGTVARIAQDTEPLSTAVISSGEPVLGVLEVLAGTSRRLGIAPGDRIEHPMFKP